MTAVQRAVCEIIKKRGWVSGSSLENTAIRMMSSGGRSPAELGCVQQYKVGSYRADFAWPDIKVIMEVDGWHHRSPEGAARDALRDSFLRAQGWLVLRVDDRYGEDAFLDQVVRVCRLTWQIRGTRPPR